MVIDLEVRRFLCGNHACTVRTFVEQVPDLTQRFQHRTPLLRALLEKVALALAGRPGARMTDVLGVAVSRSTLIRMIRALPDPEIGQVTVLGVDDFSKRRGRSYATILVSMDTHRPIDVLDDRLADTLAEWLKVHPGVDVICRDRSGAYAEGARQGAPAAIQVADRWHLWHNLAEQVEKIVARHRGCLKDPDVEVEPEPAATAPTPAESRLVRRIHERFAGVQELKASGASLTTISRTLGLDPKTVRRYYDVDKVEELLTRATGRSDLLTPYAAHLHQRWNQGCIDAAQLTTEITELGYTGSNRSVRRYLQPFRTMLTVLPPPSPVPPVRKITGLLVCHPDTLDEEEKQQLGTVRSRCEHLDRLAEHIKDFAEMMTQRQGQERLEGWLARAEADDHPELHTFTRGIRQDLQAVINGLTLEHSSGAVEGAVTRIKAIKRSLYGRANFDLLRKLILLR